MILHSDHGATTALKDWRKLKMEKVPGSIFPATFEFSFRELFCLAVSFKNASMINFEGFF